MSRLPRRHWGQRVTCCGLENHSCQAPGHEPGWPGAGPPDVVGKLSQASTPSLQTLSHMGCLLHHEATDVHTPKPIEPQKGKATVYFPRCSDPSLSETCPGTAQTEVGQRCLARVRGPPGNPQSTPTPGHVSVITQTRNEEFTWGLLLPHPVTHGSVVHWFCLPNRSGISPSPVPCFPFRPHQHPTPVLTAS